MKPPPFAYTSAGSAAEAVALLAEHGEDARILAGGQSLVPLLNMRLSRPSVLVDVSRTADMIGIGVNGSLSLGASTTFAAIERSVQARAFAPLLVDAMRWIGHGAIRARGTVGGSMAHADAAAELPAVMLALDGVVKVLGPGGARSIAAADFVQSHYTTSLEQGEIVVALTFPKASPTSRSALIEVARRHGDFALAGAIVAVDVADGTCTDARVVVFGLGDRAARVASAEAALVGSDLGADAALRAAALVSAAVDPTDDVHASADYRREVAGVVVRRAVARLDRIGGLRWPNSSRARSSSPSP